MAQKQALNALAFFMQEALSIDLGNLDFHKAKKRLKMPGRNAGDGSEEVGGQNGPESRQDRMRQVVPLLPERATGRGG